MKGQTYGPVFLTAVYWSLCQAMNKSCRLPARCSVCVCGLCVSVCVSVCVCVCVGEGGEGVSFLSRTVNGLYRKLDTNTTFLCPTPPAVHVYRRVFNHEPARRHRPRQRQRHEHSSGYSGEQAISIKHSGYYQRRAAICIDTGRHFTRPCYEQDACA